MNSRIFCLVIILTSLIAPISWASSHHPQDFLRNIQGSPQEGVKIVQHFCSSCHADPPMISLGAPRIGHPEDWTVRIQAGFNRILQHVSEGYRAMPARGGCFECSDKQLIMAIEAILPKKVARPNHIN